MRIAFVCRLIPYKQMHKTLSRTPYRGSAPFCANILPVVCKQSCAGVFFKTPARFLLRGLKKHVKQAVISVYGRISGSPRRIARVYVWST